MKKTEIPLSLDLFPFSLVLLLTQPLSFIKVRPMMKPEQVKGHTHTPTQRDNFWKTIDLGHWRGNFEIRLKHDSC